MNIISARVGTANGGKYVRQLCKHWSHKLETEIEGDRGTVTFPNAVATLAADGTGMTLTISGEERDDVERLTLVVSSHIDRFAFREDPLTYDWAWQ
jgi:Uncharacterized protein conserved in bacteria